jgi:acetolactate synthase regulatory subunit
MIAIRTKDGVQVDVEASNDPEVVERLLSRAFRPEAIVRLRQEVAKAEEIFLEFTGASKRELPRIRHHLIHLDSRPRGSVNLSTGDFVITFFVHRDHLSVVQEMAKGMKSKFKNANDWEETTEHTIESEKLFSIPPIDLD